MLFWASRLELYRSDLAPVDPNPFRDGIRRISQPDLNMLIEGILWVGDLMMGKIGEYLRGYRRGDRGF